MTSLPSFLMDMLLKGSVLLGLAAVVTYGLRRQSAATRHAVWAIALLGQLALPLLSFGLPDWDLPVLPYRAAQAEGSPTASSSTGSTTASAALGGAPTASAVRVGPLARVTLPSIAAVVIGVWLVGFVVLLGRLLAGLMAVGLLTARAEPIRDGHWLGLARRIAVALRVHRRIALLRGDRFDVPVTWGIVRPKVLLPVDADEWVEPRRRLVLMHEMAHIKRFDTVTQLLGCVAQAIFWMNPLVWLAVRQMRREQERACDDYVIRGGVTASTYARELLTMVRQRHAPMTPAAPALARRSEFEGRMMAILDPSRNRRPLNRVGMVLTGALALALMAPLAAFRPVPRPAPTPTSALATSMVTVNAAPSPLPVEQLAAAPVKRSAPDTPSQIAPARATTPKRGTPPARVVPKRNRRSIEKRQDSLPAPVATHEYALQLTDSSRGMPQVNVAWTESSASGCSMPPVIHVQLENSQQLARHIVLRREAGKECAFVVEALRVATAPPSHDRVSALGAGDSLGAWIDSDRPRPILQPVVPVQITRLVADLAASGEIERALKLAYLLTNTLQQHQPEMR